MTLSLLISGPRQPSNDIDIYLASLIEDLITLWEVGVQVYDAHQQDFFTLRVVILWTINDFLAHETCQGAQLKDIMVVQYVKKKHILVG